MTDTQTATGQPPGGSARPARHHRGYGGARRRCATARAFRVVGDEPAVMLQVHTDDSFLRFIRAAGRPAVSRTLPPAGPPADLDSAFRIAADTGQPVIGPPMSEEEAARIAA